MMSIVEDQAGLSAVDDAASSVSGWTKVLREQAPLEFAVAAYGLHDCQNGHGDTMAALAVMRAQAHHGELTLDRAEQRARAYLPVQGHEHCPRCWVLGGSKAPLRFVASGDPAADLARCDQCGVEYVNPRLP